jgi:4-amino-4-deoxy-L-arabinose transferase-like glycosyltransferase
MNISWLLKDIRIWLLILFAIRLFGITHPPLEVEHNWRQTTVTMVARNFFEVDNNILYPRIDVLGTDSGSSKTGITGMEFPIFNYLIYLSSELFGYQHWYGRLINLIFSTLGLWFFYQLIIKYFDRKVAFNATIILAVSVWFQFSRKIMPDTFAMSFILASLYYGTSYLENRHKRSNIVDLLAYSSLMLLGALSKLPSGYLFIVFLLFYFKKSIPLKRKIVFAAVSFLGLIPVAVWYFYWVPHLVNSYGSSFFMGNSISQGFNEIIEHFPTVLYRFYDTALKSIGFAAYVFGVLYAVINKDKMILLILLSSLLSFCVIIIKAGLIFPLHAYYIIPFVPVMSLLAGYGLSKIKYHKVAMFILMAISVEGIAKQQVDFFLKTEEKSLLNLESDLDKVSQPSDLILINSGAYPTPMYFSHRKGWLSNRKQIKNKRYLDSLGNKGLKYIVILKRIFGSNIQLSQFKKVLDNKDYCIYKVE